MSETRISSLDEGYNSGDLSFYPVVKDNKDNLYLTTNNASSKLKQRLSFNSRHIVVEDETKFTNKDIVRIRPEVGQVRNYELIYYHNKNGNVLSNLQRGFAESIRTSRDASKTYDSNTVIAEHHNAIKDTILK